MTDAPRPVTPVSLVAAELTDLCRTLDDDAVGAEAAGRLRRVRDLAAGLDPYLDAMTTPPSSALADLEERTRRHVWSEGPLEQEMLSGHLEGWFLRFLVGMTGARDVLEIGMFTGYSALAMAEELPDGGRVVACEVDETVAGFARTCFAASPVGDRIDVRVGPAADTLARAARAGESFDLVFVDADKPGYARYLDLLLTTDLLRPGGLIVVDNTLLQGEPYCGATTPNGRAIASFNEAVAADPRLEQVLIPLRDGVTLIRRARVREQPS